MTDFEYLSVEQILRIHADQAPGATLNDAAGIDAAAYRPASGFGDQDLFPGVWAKAAAYIHSIASPQYFSDGNKRTAWFAAIAFLKGNGYAIPDVPTIEAETFVQAVAQQVFDTSETRPDNTIKKAAEWFESKWLNRRLGRVHDPRVEYALLGVAFENTGSVFDLYGLDVYGIPVFLPLPAPAEFCVILRIHWDRIDPAIDPHILDYYVIADNGFPPVKREHSQEILEGVAGIASDRDHHTLGYWPVLVGHMLNPVFTGHCKGRVEVRLDGEPIASLLFETAVQERPPGLPPQPNPLFFSM